MRRQRFSTRFGYSGQHQDLIIEDAPEQIRVGLREVLAACDREGPSAQREMICKALRRRPDPYNLSYANVNLEVDGLLEDLEWFEFYDLCQMLSEMIEDHHYDSATGVYTNLFDYYLNKLLQEEHIGYRIEEGVIEKVGTEEFEESIAKVSELIEQRDDFGPVQQQFAKALGFRNSLPPDYPNAIKEAVNAVEGAWQVVTNKQGSALPSILSGLDPNLPSGIKKIYDGLYGYGSGSQGARHAGLGGPVPSSQEVELIIHTCAATITYALKWLES